MKILTLKLGDKTYTTGKITAYLSKEVIRTSKQALEIAKSKGDLDNLNMEDLAQLERAEAIMEKVEDLTARKAWIICEAYGNKFTPDDLERELTPQEIDEEIGRVMGAITGTMQKN